MSDKVLVIGNKNYSSWSMRPWLWMRHYNIRFTEQRVPLYTPDTASAIKAYGAASTVPILIDGDIRIWDSLAILEYLAEQYPDYAAWPKQVAARAYARAISAEMHSGFTAIRSTLPMDCRRSTPDYELPADVETEVNRINAIFSDCRQKYASDGDWLFGQYSIADAMYAPVVMRFNSYGIRLDGAAAEYLHTVTSQPAVVEWVEASHQEVEVIEQ